MTDTEYTKRWTPITKPGGIYCSPGCGCNCTRAEHDEAQRKGAELAQRMGAGWVPDVWENCMWLYGAKFIDCDGVRVTLRHGYEPGKVREGHREGIDEYACYINTSPQFIGRSTDPREAFERALSQMEQHAASINAVVCALRAERMEGK